MINTRQEIVILIKLERKEVLVLKCSKKHEKADYRVTLLVRTLDSTKAATGLYNCASRKRG